ncbi:GILT-like protein 1 isoform X2 [Diorhabda sublineata]|nr:GILT-like protein 1 isoform X2 [Diorhabda sublineata]
MTVSLFYKPFSSDSIEFITKQLFPTYKILGNLLKLELVPYPKILGNVKMNETNPIEYYATIIHACAIHMYSTEESTEFINCAMTTKDSSFKEDIIECSDGSGLNWNDIERCYKTGQYQKLLKQLIYRIEHVDRKIESFPTILLSNKFNETIQVEAKSNFKNSICEFVLNEPEYCNRDEFTVNGKTEEEFIPNY